MEIPGMRPEVETNPELHELTDAATHSIDIIFKHSDIMLAFCMK
jgi:hypothetical protein